MSLIFRKVLFVGGLIFLTVDLFAQSEIQVLSLDDCIKIALENNLTIKRSSLDYQAANITLQEGKASRYPNLNLGTSYGTNWGRSIDPTTNSFISREINTAGITGSSGLTLFSAGQIHNSIKQSEFNLAASKYDLITTENDITLNIANFYLNVLFNNELLENARLQLESTKEQLSRTKRLVEIGSLPKTSELELLSQLASNELTLINAQNDLALAHLSLKQSMMIPSSIIIEVIIPNMVVDSLSLIMSSVEQIYQNAIDVRPEMKSAQLRVEGAKMGMKVALGAYFPSLRVNANLFTNYSDAANRIRTIYDNEVKMINEVPLGYYYLEGVQMPVFNAYTTGTPTGQEQFNWSKQWKENFSQSLNFSLAIPIFNNLRTKSNVQRSKIQLVQSEIAVIERLNQLRQIIESSYNDAYASQKSYFASNRQVEALEERFRAIETQYNLGVANFTEYQVASNNLYAAKSDLVRAKFNTLFKKKVLDFYQNIPLTF